MEKINSMMFSTMIASAMEVVAALTETKPLKMDATLAAPTPAPSAEVVSEDEDGECLIAVAFGPLAAEDEEKEEEEDDDDCVIVEAFGPLAADEAAQDEDDDSSATIADELIVEAFDTFVDAPAAGPSPTAAAAPSLISYLMEAVKTALAAVKQCAIDYAIALALPTAKWVAWYAVLWVKEYAKLTLELEMKRQATAKRMKKTTHRAVRRW